MKQVEIELPFGGYYKKTNEIKKFIDKFPEWVKVVDDTYYLILTDDIDSLFACALLKYKFNCKIGYFYDFNSIHQVRGVRTTKDKIIACDMAVENGFKAYDNHVVKIHKNDEVNPQSANMNIAYDIHQGNYYQKYAGSTALMVAVMYEIFDFNTLTDEQLMTLACIDSWYLAYYGGYDAFHEHALFMDLQVFKDLFARKTIREFESFKRIHLFNEKISISKKSGKLFTFLDTDFLKSQFPMLDFSIDDLQFDIEKVKKFSKSNKKQIQAPKSKHEIDNVFSFALTSKNGYKATIK
ncbi:hypothetical protein [Rummeliibacillus sp. POC4]|uniref:hypothetical protein n=1 Tax=Rummeliibacillus sp. POC4 TaxID=2305899 RepID=UPI000E65FED6|nr:hypothetical protein [Rummeliibacillus sp. POC4]RIJ65313.1 hypothetical protein D1606_08300 [Rummeliibacillus sp. POC4]